MIEHVNHQVNDAGMDENDAVFPFRPRDWVMNELGRVGTVKAIHLCSGEILFDLVIYDHTGERIGRESPHMGGPRTFEPMCSIEGWQRVEAPSFPMHPKWVAQPDGRRLAMYWSEPLPPANWKKPKRKGGIPASLQREIDNSRLRIALEQIANGDNDARSTARQALGWK